MLTNIIRLIKSCNYSDYLAYSNLKKWIYLIEKAKLGLVTLPPSYKEVDPSIFISVSAASPRPTGLGLDEDTTPLLIEAPGSEIPSQARIERFFAEALDDQLDKILKFYGNKEKELCKEVEDLMGEVFFYEGDAHTSRTAENATIVLPSSAQNNSSSRTISPTSPALTSSSSTRSHQSNEHGPLLHISTAIPPRNRRSISLVSPDPSRVLNPSSISIGFWNFTENKSQRTKFKKKVTSLFVKLNELHDFRELNRTGFTKILKKYEKVTGLKLKLAYLERVDATYPFSTEAVDLLRAYVDKVVTVYARIVTENNLGQAAMELKSSLREHIVWERNSIWRDMVEQERRTGSLGVRKSASKDNLLTSSKFNYFGVDFDFSFLFHEKFIYCSVFCCLFAFILNLNTFESIEQQNCLAILIFASALWAFEVWIIFWRCFAFKHLTFSF